MAWKRSAFDFLLAILLCFKVRLENWKRPRQLRKGKGLGREWEMGKWLTRLFSLFSSSKWVIGYSKSVILRLVEASKRGVKRVQFHWSTVLFDPFMDFVYNVGGGGERGTDWNAARWAHSARKFVCEKKILEERLWGIEPSKDFFQPNAHFWKTSTKKSKNKRHFERVVEDFEFILKFSTLKNRSRQWTRAKIWIKV